MRVGGGVYALCRVQAGGGGGEVEVEEAAYGVHTFVSHLSLLVGSLTGLCSINDEATPTQVLLA